MACLPTPDHLYVLGYGLSQKVPDLKQINPDATPDKTPKYFIPRSYQITVTPGYTWDGAQRQDSNYTVELSTSVYSPSVRIMIQIQ